MYAEVAIPKTKLETLTYSIPTELESLIKVGSLVKIKLKEKATFGIVIEKRADTQTDYTKDIIDVKDTAFLSKELLSLLTWIKKYYLASWGEALNLTLPQSIYSYKLKLQTTEGEIKHTALAPTYETQSVDEVKRNQLPEFPAVRKIIYSLKENRYKTFLLFNPGNKDSVEIYLRMIEEALRINKSTVLLVPEIILTPIFITRFKDRLGEFVFCLHSGLRLSERKKTWHQIKNVNTAVVVGTRSAIFAPVNNLGLIVVDMEHDLSYKEQERHFHYSARDIAVVRAQMNNAITVLASATPSCESFYNAKYGKYELITIPKQERKTTGRVILIDMKRSKDKIISPKMRYEIKSAYAKSTQIVLFLNRRGYARVITCTDCGHVPYCPDCGIPLVLQGEEKSFLCNLCKHKQPAFDFCPKCKGNNFVFQGIGTQQVVSEVKQILPNSDILRLDSDTKTSATKTRRKNLCELGASVANSYKILITTKLGIRDLDFSRIGLFGIISADTSLFIPDFRAQEKTFQELTQIIGRCTTNKECKVILQTYRPDNYAIYRAVQENYLKFYEQEINLRKKLQYPPFSRLAMISITSSKLEMTQRATKDIEKKLSVIKNISVLGPSLTQQPKKPKIYTYQFLLKMKPDQSLSNLISRKDLAYDKVNVDINIDPL